ncbi:MAG: PAS domain S-box protein [Acidobacteriia bacterium]|nr:PAS domain S-box protein [Terriglobia bacterium]
MATTRMFVDQQLLLTIFLVVLLWSLYARLRKQDFFRWWAWAWTAFGGYLCFGALALYLAPAWTILRGSLILTALVCGFLQIPLLAFGASTLRGPIKPRQVWLRAGIWAALVASVLIFAAALAYRDRPMVSFALRTLPRTLALTASLFFCAWVFLQKWHRTGSVAAVITGGFCSLYAFDQMFYSSVYLSQLVSRVPVVSPVLLLSQPLFAIDLVAECGISVGIVLLLVEEYQRAEVALVKTDARAEAVAESNVALQAEITERNRMEEALRESEDRYRDLVEHSQDLLCTHDLAGKLLSCNPAPARVLGYEVAELLAISMRDIIAPEYREKFDEYLARMKTVGADKGQMAVITRTGERRIWDYDNTLRVEGVPFPIVRGMAHDITERAQAERELRASEERFRQLAENIHEVFYLRDVPSHRLLYVSLAYEQVWGRPCQSLYAAPESYLDAIHPEDREAAERSFASHVPFVHEYRIIRPDGSVRWILDRAFPVRNKKGQVYRLAGIAEDITERKRAEQALQESQATLARVTRIAAMGELTASIAHEINQPLAAVVANGSASLRWLAIQPPNLDEAREALTRVVGDANRASDVIARIRALLKKAPPPLEQLDANKEIREVLALTASELLKGGVTVQTELAADLPVVLGDRVQLQQVILNLVMNGIDAMSTIAGRPRDLLIKSVGSPEHVLIQVQDSGSGLDPEDAECIFEPFFTTKPQGIGMGLSISRSIVEAHGGRLWATPGSLHGAIFQFTLPRADSSHERAA